jgi:hypothetical protein
MRIIIQTFAFFCLIWSVSSFSKESIQPTSDEKIRTVGRCLFIKSEYIACYKKGLGKCQKKNVAEYAEYKCLKHLDGLAIEKWNDKFKKQEFTWSSTCRTVKNEYLYCKKEGLKSCYKSMQDRFKYLWCEVAIEEKLTK